MSAMPTPVSKPQSPPRLWLGYTGLALLCWLLFGMAGTDWQRGSRSLAEGLYDATWTIGPGLLLGPLALPWVRARQRRNFGLPGLLLWHALGAFGFVVLWQALVFSLGWLLFSVEHALAVLEQGLLWRAALGVFAYGALMFGFGSSLHAQRAQAEALRAAQADAARVRAELAAISGKLDPHFLFNTLNSLLQLSRRGGQAAEQGLLGFARMMRYVLDGRRGAAQRVALGDELEFVQDYLALEGLRLGERLRVDWQVDPACEDEAIPPLTLQPLIENAVVHGVSSRSEGGTISLRVERQRLAGQAYLLLAVRDDGPGCIWPPPRTLSTEPPRRRGGVALEALQRRFELDYDGRAQMHIHSQPGAGFAVELRIPLDPIA